MKRKSDVIYGLNFPVPMVLMPWSTANLQWQTFVHHQWERLIQISTTTPVGAGNPIQEGNYKWRKSSWVGTTGAQLNNVTVLLDTEDGDCHYCIKVFSCRRRHGCNRNQYEAASICFSQSLSYLTPKIMFYHVHHTPSSKNKLYKN